MRKCEDECNEKLNLMKAIQVFSVILCLLY